MKSRKLTLIFLLGFIATACSSGPANRNTESENNLSNVKSINPIHYRVSRFGQ